MFTSRLSHNGPGGNCQMHTQQLSTDYFCSVGWHGLTSRHLIEDMLLIKFITTNFTNLAYKYEK